MLPILYGSDTNQAGFAKNGFGFIKNCMKCVAIEERNGVYELEAQVAMTDRLASHIVPSRFLKVKANPYDDPQIFEIYKTSVLNNTVTINAQHMRYIAYGNVLSEPYTPLTAKTPAETWDAINLYLEPQNQLIFYSDITKKSYVTAAKDSIVRLGDFLAGKEGSMLDVYGGEFHYDNFKIELLKNRGSFSGAAVRYGSEISSFKQDSDIASMYTHLLPFATVNAKIYETGAYVGQKTVYTDPISLNNSLLTYQRVLAYDFSEDFTGESDVLEIYDYNGQYRNWDVLTDKLQNLADNYYNKNKKELTDFNLSLEIDLAETLKTLSNCRLCDTVKVYFEPMGIATTAKIVRTEYDCLLERYQKMELGSLKKTMADLF